MPSGSARSVRPTASPALAWGAGTLATLLVLWIVATSVTGIVPARVLPSPVAVVQRAAVLVATPFSGATLEGHAVASLTRWAIGVVFAIVLGIPLGILLAWLPPVRVAVNPVFELLRFIPPGGPSGRRFVST